MAAEKTAEKKVSSAESAEKAELKKKKLPVESVYSAEELADSAKNMFHTRRNACWRHWKQQGKKNVRFLRQKRWWKHF